MARLYWTTLTAFLALTACVPVEPVPSLPVTTSTAVSRADLGTLLNAARAANDLPPLRANAKLTAAARAHALDMARGGFFSHVGSNSSTPSQRVNAQEYSFCFVAENIAQGWNTPDQVMQGWMDSPGHRSNNLSTKATEFGAARVEGDYWVLVFGHPGCGAGRTALTLRKPR